ncbi:MAG: hypothetical protein N0C88_19710 [Candidatus Thiodiazotropha lotti]|uniref:Uncharacterized protein n=1 Tax=Candidatus Thiodiazotropha lotti TaxID=2792787 RepID=A0A9E4N1J9_9GAMM|nr:hypothetical protein [Candidatus Thiodiazotropha lotti]MCW4205531.1 hypothetical protein [Candidatus Thiodiazotropha lotti]
MNLQRVTYVSEHLLPLTPVYTTGEGLGRGCTRSVFAVSVQITPTHQQQLQIAER